MVTFLQNYCSYLIKNEYGSEYPNVLNVLKTGSEC